MSSFFYKIINGVESEFCYYEHYTDNNKLVEWSESDESFTGLEFTLTEFNKMIEKGILILKKT